MEYFFGRENPNQLTIVEATNIWPCPRERLALENNFGLFWKEGICKSSSRKNVRSLLYAG